MEVVVDPAFAATLQYFADRVRDEGNWVEHKIPEIPKIKLAGAAALNADDIAAIYQYTMPTDFFARLNEELGIDATFDKWRDLARLSNEVTAMMKELCETGHLRDLVKVAGDTFDDPGKLATLSNVLFKDNFFDDWARSDFVFLHDYYITIMTQFHAKVTELCAELRLAGRVLQSSFADRTLHI